MVSMQLSDAGALVEAHVPPPSPAKGEVLVRVCAAGIIHTELNWYPTTHTENGAKRLGAVPAHEFSGEIVELGEPVDGLARGEEIYGMNDWYSDGALAEYCITRPEWVAPKPRSLHFAEAASVPISALTAWQGLYERARLRAGERVLVQGGAGGVGIFAIQLARLRGAHVITTVSAKNMEFAAELGAHEVIDYHASRFEDRVGNVDVVFDTVGGETLDRSWGVLNRGGRLVTIVSENNAAGDPRIQKAFFIVEPRREQLIQIATLIDSGELRTVISATVPFWRAPDAYADRIETNGRGKVVVILSGRA